MNGPAKSFFFIRPIDPQWQAWLDHLEPEQADAAKEAGQLTAFGGRWPDTAHRVHVDRKPRPIGGDR